MKPIKIIHVINDLHTGGAEMMLYKILQKTDHEKFEPSVISIFPSGNIGKRIQELGISVMTLNVTSPLSFFPGLIKLLFFINKIKPNILQGWMYHGNLIATLMFFFTMRKVKLFWNIRHSLHDIHHEKKTTQLVIFLGKKLSFLPNQIICNSRKSISQHIDYGYKRDAFKIIPNGFDIDKIKEIAQKERPAILSHIKASNVIIGKVARFHPMKGYDIYINAAQKIHQEHPNIHFLGIGRGVTHNNPEFSKDCKLKKTDQSYIHLLGEQSNIIEILHHIDIFTLSSKWGEGFSNALGEAMASKLLCVATDIGDNSIILDESGIIISPNNTEELIEAWKEFLSMSNEKKQILSLSAQENIVKNYSIDYIASEYETLYFDSMH